MFANVIASIVALRRSKVRRDDKSGGIDRSGLRPEFGATFSRRHKGQGPQFLEARARLIGESFHRFRYMHNAAVFDTES